MLPAPETTAQGSALRVVPEGHIHPGGRIDRACNHPGYCDSSLMLATFVECCLSKKDRVEVAGARPHHLGRGGAYGPSNRKKGDRHSWAKVEVDRKTHCRLAGEEVAVAQGSPAGQEDAVA